MAARQGYNPAMPLPRVIGACTLGVSLSAVPITAAQPVSQLQPVEPVYGDMNPLSLSLRRLEPGLARPMMFDRVFRAPGEPGKLMRAHGGVYAVFPQSLYLQSEEGVEAAIPPGTVFRIGPRQELRTAVPEHLQRPAAIEPAGMAPPLGNGLPRESDPRRVLPEPYTGPHSKTRAAEERQPRDEMRPRPKSLESPDESASVELAGGTIFGDDGYRRQRVRNLLEQAAAAERQATRKEPALSEAE